MKPHKQQLIINKKLEDILQDLDKLAADLQDPDKRKMLQASKHLWIAARIIEQKGLIEIEKKAGDYY